MERYTQLLREALDAVFANKARSILTALGIIFGVAAVIAMLAIGRGARQEILDQMKLVGVNNIVIKAKPERKNNASGEQGKQERKPFSPGLTLEDAEAIGSIIPGVQRVSPEVSYETMLIKDGSSTITRLNGVHPEFFEVFGFALQLGNMFTQSQLLKGEPVCVIGQGIQARLFALQDPLGQYIKCGNVWLRIVGVLEKRPADPSGSADPNNEVFAPLNTVLLRFRDRSMTNLMPGGSGEVFISGGDVMIFADGEEGKADASQNNHQLDRIVVQMNSNERLGAAAEIISRMLSRRHFGVEDFEVTVPELLLKQEQRTRDIFNIVLGAIAGISLLVGGIGIMNIMLASVMERIREIGVRRAVGATRRDIVFQFLSEATLISISGGIAGILLGLVMSQIIMQTTGILTIISPLSIFISFGVSATVGIIFGYLPAKRAAMQDPVESLRHD
ncbi:MAG TPA: ABC transporter permease [Bacteroidales bacterium]|nr:ABC transporter permease [Bacteroidales bacterium]